MPVSTNIFHDVYPFTMATLVMLDGRQVALHADYIPERKDVLGDDLRQSTRMKGPPVVATFVLHANVSLVRDPVHSANLESRFQIIKITINYYYFNILLNLRVDTFPM